MTISRFPYTSVLYSVYTGMFSSLTDYILIIREGAGHLKAAQSCMLTEIPLATWNILGPFKALDRIPNKAASLINAGQHVQPDKAPPLVGALKATKHGCHCHSHANKPPSLIAAWSGQLDEN